MSRVKWIDEQVMFEFREVVDAAGESDLVVELVMTGWQVPGSVKRLCAAMADARGASSPNQELRAFLTGRRDYFARRAEEVLAWSGPGRDLARELLVQEESDPGVVTARLEALAGESGNGYQSAAWVLDAALSEWGYFIGNVSFTEESAGVVVHRFVPRTAEELDRALAPWLEQLPEGDARASFAAAALAAMRLDGVRCRELCYAAAAHVGKP